MSHEILDFENFQKSKLSEIYVLFDTFTCTTHADNYYKSAHQHIQRMKLSHVYRRFHLIFVHF